MISYFELKDFFKHNQNRNLVLDCGITSKPIVNFSWLCFLSFFVYFNVQNRLGKFYHRSAAVNEECYFKNNCSVVLTRTETCMQHHQIQLFGGLLQYFIIKEQWHVLDMVEKCDQECAGTTERVWVSVYTNAQHQLRDT